MPTSPQYMPSIMLSKFQLLMESHVFNSNKLFSTRKQGCSDLWNASEHAGGPGHGQHPAPPPVGRLKAERPGHGEVAV